MVKEPKIAAFEGGSLNILAGETSSKEVVVGLPLSRLLVKLVRVEPGADAVAVAEPIMQALSPYPDEPLTVSCETVDEKADGSKTVIAAALPESSAEDIGEALDAAKLNVVRIDILALGALRGVWSQLEGEGRRLVIFKQSDCLSMLVLDNGEPRAIRAITQAAELRREVMLTLLEAENFGDENKLSEIVVVKTAAPESPAVEGDATTAEDAKESKPIEEAPAEDLSPYEGLSIFAPVRWVESDPNAALIGIGERTKEAGSLNALPASWAEVLAETRFKAKLVKNLAIAGGIWMLVMGVLFGVPVAYGYMTDYQKSLCKQHEKQYKAVAEKKKKTEIVQQYSNHLRGALEIMKAVSDRMPPEEDSMTLLSWDFSCGEAANNYDDGYLKIKGEADSDKRIYDFKDSMVMMGTEKTEDGEEGVEGEPVFGMVKLSGVVTKRGSQGRYTFNLDCRFGEEEEE